MTDRKLERDVTAVMKRFDQPDDRDWCGWQLYGSTEDPAYLLITCDVDPEWARTMPGGATDHGVAMALSRYADALTDAGFGTAHWVPAGLLARALIVAADQAAADAAAPGVCALLNQMNPHLNERRAARSSTRRA